MSIASLLSLKNSGLIHDVSHEGELGELLNKEKLVFYCGFDPTASSLHAGSLLPLILAKRLLRAGHQPIIILGSATGMIGDPSGKSAERKLLETSDLEYNAQAIGEQIRGFLQDSSVEVLLNNSWLGKLNYIEFLRDIGKHFSANAMIAKDSVKSRLENREQGISYTEFSYMLLQAYDFYWLAKNKGCSLQVGGSDQWGNITAGIELVRRVMDKRVYGLTFPLLTSSSGQKLGKTEEGALWLDREKTSPYRFYQYWLNTSDTDVVKLIKYFSEKSPEEIAELEKSVIEMPEKRAAQKELAFLLTSLVHGEKEVENVLKASTVLFGGDIQGLSAKELCEIFSEVPSTSLQRNKVTPELTVGQLVVQCKMASSNSEARRLVDGGGFYINNVRQESPKDFVSINSFIDGSVAVLRSGKKKFHLIKLLS